MRKCCATETTDSGVTQAGYWRKPLRAYASPTLLDTLSTKRIRLIIARLDVDKYMLTSGSKLEG
ncbi:hypothetical protein BABINDRAFT_162958 [Babjeviella inositovora NRRL Y-12698]|uniref:Uncharacterized protein n=1 Tax=Babjeviella inositovora NRRL Y-12698 TaxID=984486 RepID=A0A1E3QKW1_9ASCO|nr:uncharacterized protein BABINDRAFT_162958 [Babjeviella inositovora NRRL Y-12698]ODQ78315.1 hypothetical protein BABINDRAFT_162958 [Babjeviella inositovora NRRL Y-12698]